MNEYIINKWNSVVVKDDIVYHFGDVGFGSTEELKKLVSRLNGTKILIRGNHDYKRGLNAWKKVGFSEVYKKKLILTYEPIEAEENYINIFGYEKIKILEKREKTGIDFIKT